MGIDMRLVEGSEIRVLCTFCGKHQWTISIIQGVQRLQCPICAHPTKAEFQRTQDGGYSMRTDAWYS